MRMMQSKASGAAVNEHRVQTLDFVDDLDNLSESLEGILDLIMALENAATKIELQINMKKTNILEFLDSEFDSIAFEKVEVI